MNATNNTSARSRRFIARLSSLLDTFASEQPSEIVVWQARRLDLLRHEQPVCLGEVHDDLGWRQMTRFAVGHDDHRLDESRQRYVLILGHHQLP